MTKGEEAPVAGAAGYQALDATPASPHGEAAEHKHEGELPESVTHQICLELDGESEKWWGHEEDLGDDAWGAAIVSFARSLAVIGLKREAGQSVLVDLLDLLISVAVMLSNLVLQLGVLWYIWQFVVEPAVHSVQLQYRHFRAHALDENGTLVPEVWETYEFKDEVCEIAMVNIAFYYSIILLWMLTNMSEWLAIERLGRCLHKMQNVPSLKEALYFSETGCFEKGGPCLILGFTPLSRAMIYLLVVIPRFLISLFLSWLGLRMLTSSASFSDMVLNSLALGFVISIDELLCQAILPVATRKHMEETNLFIKEGHSPKTLAEVQDGEWKGFRRNLLLMLASAVYLFLYGEYLQQVLPLDVRQVNAYCTPYIKLLQEPICSNAAYMGGGSCYPPGVGDRFDNDV